MKIVHFSAECYPVAKVGGLGDVAGALPKYQNLLGHNASVIMPYYKTKFVETNAFKTVFSASVTMHHAELPFQILQDADGKLGFDLFLVHIPFLLDRDKIYGFDDDTERFIAYQKAALDFILNWKEKPDIIHCHDHHSGLVPFMVAHGMKYALLNQIPTVLTIHNGQYQGWFDTRKINLLPYFSQVFFGLLEWGGKINPLASAIKCAWRVTTVSPSYLEEISLFSNGLESLLQAERDKCMGILNGIDTTVWNPETDEMLFKNYSVKTHTEGKEANKTFICEEFGLNPNKPLFSFIGRLVGEKGADLLPQAIFETLTNLYGRLNILVLGSGEKDVESGLQHLQHQFGGSYSSYIGYNERLSHLIYAGSDFLLMPSRVEPCGLNQLYALKYGTIPIVRRTGGLKDTVTDIGDPGGFGFCHDQANVWDIQYSIKRALMLYHEKEKLAGVKKHIMQIDHSWENQTGQYIKLYKSLLTT